jgi:hypothetical protein
MTKVMVEGVGWIDIVVVLDWDTKTIVGHDAGLRCPAQHWLQAIDMALNRQFPQGVRGQGLSLMRDNGCQPTATAFMQACSLLGIAQAFTNSQPAGQCRHRAHDADAERGMPLAARVDLSWHRSQCPRELDRWLQRALLALSLGRQVAQAG